ncbi:MAG: hypothetical protein H8D87_02440 [Deltaproteobacteria bacterium]|uniref:hypothetical protein n=1 Tax=Desulfobacula sp. TaxID=2593537 RepID=UPI0019CD9FD5|nr:hypothetical protein [Candidatus Desulfobacula maris]MBL6992907.1 hypothetical protein [Desulfobacula sp.]
MKILVCIKQVSDSGDMNQFDEHALEQALLLKEQKDVLPLEREFLAKDFKDLLPRPREKQAMVKKMELWAPNFPVDWGTGTDRRHHPGLFLPP